MKLTGQVMRGDDAHEHRDEANRTEARMAQDPVVRRLKRWIRDELDLLHITRDEREQQNP